MATTIQLNVLLNKATAEADIQKLDAAVRKINNTPAVIQIQVQGAQAAANTLAKIDLEQEKRASKIAVEQERRITKEGEAHARAALQAQKHSDKMEELAARTNQAASASNALSVALGAIAARSFHLIVSKITQGIREAVTEMKEVDTQLTNISKVSGLTGKALSDMGERAYETASRYGVAADEYLSAVYTFQKAGLGPSAEAMGELAVKTMLVGDTTADVASQFLISANAAWKFGGDINRLNQIVDEADYINNNYATDLQKLSQGLPRVASVAAQAGMSAEETLAAIGTITAVTQESGTKSATALRALILNIEKEVGEFMDDTGETFKVTEESVKSVQGLMEKYAKAELDAAKASGELINPMTAIRAIFEGMANADLNDQDLFALLSGMGGKLRTNQLTALVQNYELFDDMLNKIADSAGTADGEIALMMESWERKTQVLKNTWTEFVADFVNTSTIKGAIDDLTKLISDIDDALFSSQSEQTKSKYADLHDEMLALEAKGESLNGIEQERLAYLKAQTEELERQGRMQAEQEAKRWQMSTGRSLVGTNPDGTPLYSDQAMYESLTAGWGQAGTQFGLGNISATEYIAQMKKVVEANRDYYDNLVKCKDAGVELTDWQQSFVTDWEAANRVTEAGNVSLRETADGYYEIVDAQGNVLAWTDKYSKMQEDAAAAEAERQEAQAEAAEERAKALEESTAAIDRDANAMIGITEEAGKLTDAQTDAATEASNIASNAAGIDFGPAAASAQALARALTVANMMAAGISVAPFGFASGTTNAPGGETLVNELGPELISENGRAYIANGGKPAVVNLSKGAVVLPANVTEQALRGGGVTKTINAAAGGLGAHDGTPTNPGVDFHAITEPQYPTATVSHEGERYIPGIGWVPETDTRAGGWKCPKCGTENPASAKKCSKCGAQKPGTDGGGNGGKGDSKPKKSKKEQAEDAAKKLAKQLTNIDKRAQLAHTEKRYDDEQALYDKAIKLINAQIKRYRNAGYKNTSDEIVDLKNKRYSYKDKRKSAEQAKYDAEIEMLEAARDERKRQEELEKREQAVADAQTALENAQKQRTVRVFNAATGQWEWVADQKAVQQAEERLQSAQESYRDTVEDQALDELKRRRERGDEYEGITLTPTDITKRNSYADMLGAVYGTAPMDVGGGAISKSMGGDSHDTIYNFGSITLSEAEAQSTSVAELAKRLNVLKIS